MTGSARGRRRRIRETNYGRDTGWYIERRGERVAMLIEPRSVDMFWDSYLLVPLTDDTALRQQLRMDSFWNHAEDEGLVYRSREFGTIARHAFPTLNPLREPGRIVVRGLYLVLG